MNIKKLTLGSAGYPERLSQIPSPPKVLYHAGAPLDRLLERPAVAIVGTRKISPYGRQVTSEFAHQLAGQGLVIISGLAFGVDATAHQAALEAGGLCIAVLPSPLDNVVPVANRYLARRILGHGGALVSEYEPGEIPFRQNFIARNRLVSGLANAVVITEAPLKSGALHTANFAVDQGREVLVVPGNIYAPGSTGIHNLLKQSQAAPATSYKDVLNALGLADHQTAAKDVRGRNVREQAILDLILRGVNDGQRLLEQSGLATSEFNQTLAMLEINGLIRPLGANQWAIR